MGLRRTRQRESASGLMPFEAAEACRAYADHGRLDSAIPLLQDALRRAQRALGADHPVTELIRGNLATAMVESGTGKV